MGTNYENAETMEIECEYLFNHDGWSINQRCGLPKIIIS